MTEHGEDMWVEIIDAEGDVVNTLDDPLYASGLVAAVNLAAECFVPTSRWPKSHIQPRRAS